MSRPNSPAPDPSAVSGRTKPPPFARLPDPKDIFAGRAVRFRTLADGHELKPFLLFLADLSQAQSDIQKGLPEPQELDAAHIARAKEHKMPPLNRSGFRADPVFDETFKRLLAEAEKMEAPALARAALERVKTADAGSRDMMVHNVLGEAVPVEHLAEHIYAAAALQVHFTRLASRLTPTALQDLGHGICPACGGAPSSALVGDWKDAPGTRYCACSLCSTLWNYIRVQCTLCGSNKKIVFKEIEGTNSNIKAECCEECNGYLKILYQQKNPDLDPIADDVASLGLDLLVRELGFRRGGVNPFLIGY